MANFYNPKYDTSDLIKFTENTVERASFQQIQESLTNKMKEIYGNDIDLNSTTGDGQIIMARSLIIDKMFSVIVNLQQCLNPATSRGTFLDVICSFNNVFRKGQSYSTVQCYVRPINNKIINGYIREDGFQEIRCIDPNSNIWLWEEPRNADGSYNTNFNYVPCVARRSDDTQKVVSHTYYKKSAEPVDRSDYEGKYIDTNGYQYTTDVVENPSKEDWYEVDVVGEVGTPCEAHKTTDTTINDQHTYYTREHTEDDPGEYVDNDHYKYTAIVTPTDEISPYNQEWYELIKEGGKIKDGNIYTSLVFTCQTIGSINAVAGGMDKSDPSDSAINGDVGKTIDINRYPFKVWQVEDADLGNDIESDESLRTRRELEMGNNSVTVLSGLEGALRQIAGIKDVKIINNFDNDYRPTDGSITPSIPNINGGDHAKVNAHAIYVVIRYEEKIVEENIKGYIIETILNKLTPGVTTDFAIESGETLLYGEKIEGKIDSNVFAVNPANIYWKKCIPQTYAITLNILINKDFNDSHKKKIKKSIINYTKEITLNEQLTMGGLISAINQDCIAINGVNPYIALNGTITGATDSQYAENHLSYFDYSDDKIDYSELNGMQEYNGENYEMRTINLTLKS